MDYNSLFSTKEECIKTLGILFNFKLGNVPIKVWGCEVTEPPYSFFDSMKYEVPYSYSIQYTIGLENGELMTTDVVEIPKMFNGSFLIPGSVSVGGVAVRTPVNLIRIEKPIGVYTKGTTVTISASNYSFKIENGASPNASILIKNGLKREDEVKKYLLGSYFKNNNLPYTVNGLTLNTNDSEPSDYPVIRVSKRTFDVMSYLFDYDLEKYQDKLEPGDQNIYVLTPKDIYNIWYLANTNLEKIDRVSPFDLTFGDQSTSILRHFKHNTRMRTQIFGRWSRSQNKVNKIYTEPVQRYVDSYFRMQSESSKDLQVANDTNALDLLSQQRKCYLSRSDGTKVPLSYGEDYIGIIDPGKTHEGSSTSIRNELARGIRQDEDGLKIRLINAKTNELEWVDLLTHYKSSVLSTSSWDYEENKLVVNKDGKIQILKKGRYYYVDKNYKYDYRRVYRDDILGYGTSSIPMVNLTDHTRIALGTSQLDQAIPTEGCKPPVVSTGVEKEIFKISGLNIKSEFNGVVENVTEDYVKIKRDDGKFVVYQIPNPIETKSHTSQFFSPVVKIGDKVKKDDVVVETNSFKQGQLSLATPLLVAYTDYELGTFEDSTIISESAATKLGHKSMTHINIPIIESQEYVFGKDKLSFRPEFSGIESGEFIYLNDLLLPEIGDKIDPGQLIFAYLYESEEDLDKVMRLRRLINPETKIYQKVVKRVPKNIRNGVVKDVYITIKNKDYPIANEIYDYYRKVHDKQEKEQINDIGYSIPKSDKSKYLRSDQVAMITIEIECINQVKIGDKVSNRFGTKGLIKTIMKDADMPKMPDGTPVDMIVGAESVLSRKNIAQIYEVALGLACKMLWEKSKKIIDSDISKTEKEKLLREILNTLFITDRFSKSSYKELLEEFNKFDGYYQIVVPSIDNKYTKKENIFKILKLAGMPTDGKFTLTIGNRKTTNPVVCGISSIERLHFIAENKSKSTSGKGGNKKSDLAIGQGGQIKSTGQRLGAAEIYALQAYGTLDLLNHIRQEKADYGHDVQQELNALGLELSILMEDDE